VVGKSFGTAEVHLEAADALADHYAPALAEAGFEPLVPSQQCYSEELSEAFPADSYDPVFARNTLDHSLDPLKCFEEMVAVARPGGVILTQHAENEGLAENYAGLHGWNFTLEEGHVVVWNEQDKSRVVDRLAGSAEPVREWEETQGRYNLIFGPYRKL